MSDRSRATYDPGLEDEDMYRASHRTPGATTLTRLIGATGAPSRASSPGKVASTMRLARSSNGAGEGPDAATSVARAEGDTGAPLPAQVRGELEGALGQPLDQVRVHTDAASQDAAAQVGAKAYAQGQDIHFNRGQFDPDSREGKRLLAHEVAHTVQQRGASRQRQAKLEVSQPGDAQELQADKFADAFVAGFHDGLAEVEIPEIAPGAGAGADVAAKGLDGTDRLPETPGEARTSESLTAVAPSTKKIEGILDGGSLSELDRLYEDVTGQRLDPGKGFSDALRTPVWDVNNALAAIPAQDHRDRAKGYFRRDLSGIVSERFKAKSFDYDAFAARIAKIRHTYEKLGELFRDRRMIRTRIDDTISKEPAAERTTKEQRFERRSELFLDYAKDKLNTAGVDFLLEQLAGDIAAFEDTDRSAPVASGTGLVYDLMGPQLDGFGEIEGLYRKVVDAVRRGATLAGSDLLYMTAYQYPNVVLEPTKKAAKALIAAGDKTKIEQFRASISRMLGQYLAGLDETNAFAYTSLFLTFYPHVLVPYGVSVTVPKEITEHLEKGDTPAPAPAPTPTPKPKPTPTPSPPRHVHAKKTYDWNHIYKWLDAYWTKPAKFKTTELDPQVIQCQFNPSHGDSLDQVSANVAAYRAMAGRVLGILDKSVSAAKAKDAKIVTLRKKVGMKAAASTRPDYARWIASDFWAKLSSVASDKALDVSESAPLGALDDHFFLLEFYQNTLIKALEFAVDARKKKLDRYFHDNYADTYAKDYDALLDQAGKLPGWTDDNKSLGEADGMVAMVSRLTGLFEIGEGERTESEHAEIEQEVYTEIQALLRYRGKAWFKDDILTIDEVWKPLSGILTKATTPADKKVARSYAESAVRELNQGRLDALADQAGMAASQRSNAQASKLLARVEKMQRYLGTEKHTASIAQFKKFIRGETTNVIAIYSMAATALGVSQGEAIRRANLMTLGMKWGGTSSLTETVNWLKGNKLTVFANLKGGFDADKGEHTGDTKTFLKGSLKTWADQFFTGHGFGGIKGGSGLREKAFETEIFRILSDIQRERTSGALYYLLAAEQSKGGMARKRLLGKLASKLDGKDTSISLPVAEFIYAYALDAIHLLDDSINKNAYTRSQAIKSFEKGEHPVHLRPLNSDEKHWFERWGKINGETTSWYEISDKSWARVRDFAKEMLKVAVLAWATGGIGGFIGGSVGLGTIGTGVLNAALFTSAQRLLHTAEGKALTTSFGEDFLLNLVTLGAAKFGEVGMLKLFKPPPGTIKAGLTGFAGEYAAVNAVQIGYIAAKQGGISGQQLLDSLLHNFAFIAGFKGASVLGAWTTTKIENQYLKQAPVLERADIQRLEALDLKIAEHAKAVQNAKDSGERLAALERQQAVINKKAEVIDDIAYSKSAPALMKVAGEYRAAIKLYEGDLGRAQTMTKIEALPEPGTPHFTYAGGPYGETTLAKQLAANDIPYTVKKGVRGMTFEALIDGTVIRFRPRGIKDTGAGTARGAFSEGGRIEKTYVRDSGSVMEILNLAENRTITHPSIPKTKRSSFSVTSAAGEVHVQVQAVDAITVRTPHRHGPVAMEIRVVPGKAGDPPSYEAVVQVERGSTNDHIVRGVNHEMVELQQAMAKVKKSAPGGDLTKISIKKAQSVIGKEARAEAFSRRGGKATAHDRALLDGDAGTLLKQLDMVLRKKADVRRPEEHVELQQRLDRIQADIDKLWRMLNPKDTSKFGERVRNLEKTTGTRLSAAARDMLDKMQLRREHLPQITEVDIHDIFEQLRAANPDRLAGSTYKDLVAYYHQAIKEKAIGRMQGIIDGGGTKAQALAAGKAIVKDLAGGTSIPSWRGRAFEGRGIDELNADPNFVAEYGFLAQIKLNNYPTYDAIGIKNLTGKPREKLVEIGGKPVQEIWVGNKRVYRAPHKGKPAMVDPSAEITMFSFKNKKSANLREMEKALGTPSAPTGERMVVNKEYIDNLDTLISRTNQRVSDLTAKVAAGDAGAAGKLSKQQDRLRTLQHYKDNVVVSENWPAAKLDALLDKVRRVGIDPLDLENELKKALKSM